MYTISMQVLKNRLFIFWTKFVQKVYFLFKNRTNDYHHKIQYTGIGLGTKFHLNQIILPFWVKFAPKGFFWSIIKATTYNHIIPHIWISLGTNFHLIQTGVIFWTKYAPKRCFLSKAGQMTIAIEFSIFKLV